MAATSTAQRRAFAVAEHHPSESYYPRLTELPHATLHEFAATKEKGLPYYVKGSTARRKRLSDYAKRTR
jgi:hypothetical protein